MPVKPAGRMPALHGLRTARRAVVHELAVSVETFLTFSLAFKLPGPHPACQQNENEKT
jgi:hypothetical protein